MLIAYHESYLFLIRICALFCLLVMLYNLYDHISEKPRKDAHLNRARKIRELLEAYPDSSEADRKSIKKALKRMLRRPSGLRALQTALDKLHWTQSSRMPREARELLSGLLSQVFPFYRFSEDYIHSLLIDMIIRCDAESEELNNWLLKCVESPHLLVRTEALRCVCFHGEPKGVLYALERISRKPLAFSNKLITDTLMLFPGDKLLLADTLWAALDRLSPEIQVSAVQLVAAVDNGSYVPKVTALMKNEKAHMEVRIAAIKYFGQVSAPECVPYLTGLLQAENWEYAAVAAKSLERYDCTGIFDALQEGICSKNWYVRNNCARAIVRGCSAEQVRQALEIPDRYGRDSVRYALEMKEKEVAAV